MIPRCLSSPVSDPIYCRICLYVAPLALLYALLKIPQGDLAFAELNIHADMTVRFFVGQKNQRLNVAETYLLSRVFPFFGVCNNQKSSLLDQDFIIFRNDGTSCGCHASLDFTTH